MRARAIVMTAIILSLCGCGSGSGGGGNDAAGRDAACGAGACEPESPPVVDPTSPPMADPTPTPVLACRVGAEAGCPDGYRCVDDSSDACEPANGDADCAGICVLGDEMPSCGRLQAPCPDGTVCVYDAKECEGGPAGLCPATCQPQSNGSCTSDADCPVLAAVCEQCADGSFSCPVSRCDDGACVIDKKTCEPPSQCGGLSGATCPPGQICVDDPSDACDQNTGADCPGVCRPGNGNECQSDADCVTIAACIICADGMQFCPTASCVNGQCAVDLPPCNPRIVCGDDGSGCGPGEACVPVPDGSCDPATGICKGVCIPEEPECRADSDCPRIPTPCNICPDGSEACSTFTCVNGRCALAMAGCESKVVCGDDGSGCPPGETCVGDGNNCDPATGLCKGTCVPDTTPCTDDSQCPQIRAPCIACPDGTFSCPESKCVNGACSFSFSMCAVDPGFCGGVAGFPCPPGLTCIDDPNDDCDPNTGGVDCGGMCVRDDGPKPCGGLMGSTCPAGYECADDPTDECDPSVGADCPGICRPAPPPPGCQSDDQCVVGAPCHLCADGSAACPRAACINGACEVKFETCPPEP